MAQQLHWHSTRIRMDIRMVVCSRDPSVMLHSVVGSARPPAQLEVVEYAYLEGPSRSRIVQWRSREAEKALQRCCET